MKIALMFSGQPRNVVQTYHNHIKPNILDANAEHEIDVFVHTWFHKRDIGSPYLSAIDTVISSNVESSVVSDIVGLYSPVHFEYSAQIPFDERDYATNKYPFIKPKSSLSKMFSNRIVMNHVMNYMHAHNMTYDLVVSGRFDYGFNEPVRFDAQTSVGVHYVGNNPHGVNVSWCGGDVSSMNAYCDLFFAVEGLFRRGVPFCDEILAEAYLREMNIPVYPFIVSYSLIRG